MTLWAILWRYYDGSGSGIVRIYKEQTTARADLDLLKEHADGKEWTLMEVPYVGY